MQGLCMLAALCECVTPAGGVKTQLSHRGDRSYGDECTSRSVDCFASLLYTYDLPTDAPAHTSAHTRSVRPAHPLSGPHLFCRFNAVEVHGGREHAVEPVINKSVHGKMSCGVTIKSKRAIACQGLYLKRKCFSSHFLK